MALKVAFFQALARRLSFFDFDKRNARWLNRLSLIGGAL
jgi:hypothetical protein